MRNLLFIFFISLLFPVKNQLSAQNFPPMDISPMDIAMARPSDTKPPVARVIYSRPQKKGRKIFGDLVPYGKVWRTGANEATEFRLYEPMNFGDICLDEGTYTLYTIPQKDHWTIIINRDVYVWGAFSYKKEKDAARLKVPTQETAAPVEALSMIFRNEKNGITLLIGWDTTFVEIPFEYVRK